MVEAQTCDSAPPASSGEIVLAAGLRSTWTRAGGAFRGEDAGHLGAAVVRELLARTGIDPASVTELIAGSVGPPHDQANVARVIALRAGLPKQLPARTVARNCASGIEAVTTAAASIRAGEGSLYVCVGVEVMSAYPLLMGRELTQLFERLSKARSLPQKLGAMLSFRPRFLRPRIALMEGLTDPVSGLIMGKSAELLAREHGISREAADRFALESHRRAKAARDAGRFAEEILPLLPLGAKSGTRAQEHDDGIRDDQSLEALQKLRPYFEKPDGVVTVGNSCGITDGACALIVTTAQRARELGLRPLAKLRSFAWAGCDPARMGLGPVYASRIALARAGCALSDMQVIELNEAFAVQVLACTQAFDSASFAKKELGSERALGAIDPARLNPNGGAIALGHPVGATGARLLLTLAHELRRRDAALGLATLCIGGGQGGAVVLERTEDLR
ncbi:MAG: thiolase family protein [Planctomycetes bacterium]|nr:thiolase family protein [Planctomycetota bacterium]